MAFLLIWKKFENNYKYIWNSGKVYLYLYQHIKIKTMKTAEYTTGQILTGKRSYTPMIMVVSTRQVLAFGSNRKKETMITVSNTDGTDRRELTEKALLSEWNA